MASSLAAQLADIGTLDRERLQAATSKFRPSFLFPPRQAASLNNEEIHSLAYNGYLALLAQDNRFERFENPIFGEKAKLTDRTILTKEENVKLDAVLNSLLRLLASRFLLKSAGKVLEWLIRRFRINDFNVEELVRVILPYHETPQFVQMLQIIKLDGHAKFQAFEAVKTSLQPMPRHHLLTALSKSHDLFRFVANAVEPYRIQGCLYSTLTAFWAGSLLAYIEKTKSLQPQDMSILLPVIMQGIKSDNRDLRLGSYIILSHLTARTELSQETASLLAETLLLAVQTTSDMEEQEAALTTLAIVCGHQDPALAPFSAKAAVLPYPALSMLVSLAQKSNITALLRPLFATLLKVAQEQPALADQLHDILAPPSCPLQITEVATRIMLESSAAQKAIPSAFEKLLESIEQRLPEDVSLLSFANGAQHGRLVHLLEKLENRNAGEGRPSALGPTIKHRDAAIRATRLEQDLKNDGNDTNEEGTKAALLEALSDSSLEVATVLYNVKNRSKLASICASEADAVYQRCLSDSPSDVDGNLIVKRADFLVNTFAGVVDENWRIRILTEYLWPHLLATKHSLNKTNGIWDVVVRSDKKTWPVFKAARESVLTTEEDAITFNDKLVDMLCKIWYTDDASQAQFTRFLSASVARNTSAHGKASTLSQLVVLRLLAGGDCKYALAVLEHLPVGSALAAASSLYGTSKLPTVLARRLWSKYASPKTQNALAGAVFGTALHAVAASKPTAEWSWLAASADLSKEIKQHRALINRVYEVSHSTQMPDECRRRVIETLLTVQLRADVLAFLAGIYTTGAEGIRSIALRDVAMFIEQHSNLDYQVLLPSLVQALAVGKRAVCQEALRVLHAMQNAITDGNSEGLYGLDTFYGVFSEKAKYLDRPQYFSLLQAILRDEASLLVDGNYMQQVFVNALEAKDTDEKRLTKQSLVGFFVSHIVAWRSIPARTTLLSSIQRIADDKRSALLQPLLTESSEISQSISSDDVVQDRDYWKLVLKGYKTRSISDEVLQTITNIVKGTKADTLAVSLRDETRNAIQTWVLPSCSPEQRTELFRTISDLVQDNATGEVVQNLEVLRSCLGYADVLQAAVTGVREALANRVTDGQSAKKARSGLLGVRDLVLARLGLVLENAEISGVTSSLELLASLLSLLATLVDVSSSQSDVDYYIQLTTTRASEVATILPAAEDDIDLRVGPVLETIRISSNPAISNAALNLMADLARLAPAQVAQNVMPIFTFMGTNVLQRDDAQSTRVVDKTIRTIVPALVEQRRQRALSTEQLVSEMEEVLRVFVDAATHVPRHRRLHLFIRFVDILGPLDFLAPVCTLMVDKVALKYVKTRDASLLALPLGVYQHFAGDLQLIAIHQQLVDLHKKVESLNSDAAEESVSSRHSSPVTPAESPMLPVRSSRRTVFALLYFLQEVASSKKLSAELQKGRNSTDTEAAIVPQLVDITNACIQLMGIKAQKLSQTDLAQLSTGSQYLVKTLSRVMSTTEFAKILTILIGHSSDEVSDLGIDMLVERLSYVKSNHRQLLSPAVSSALTYLSGVLVKTDSRAKRLHAVLRIRAISAYCSDEEAAQLYHALVSVLSQAEKSTSTTFNQQALMFVTEAVPLLGGRIIPAVHRLLALTNSLIRQHLASAAVAASRNIATIGFSVLETLLQCTPTFVAKEIKTVLDLCVSVESKATGDSDAIGVIKAGTSKVISICTKKLPVQSLYQALQELYSQKIITASAEVSGVVTILAQTIRQTSTRTVAEMHKSLFAQLVAIFDTRSFIETDSKTVDDIEKAAVGAFMQLVLKLNEATFRPLFMRLVDWTTPGDLEEARVSEAARQLTFFKILDRLLLQLKGIAMPYYGLALDTTVHILTSNPDDKLWSLVLSSLRRALEADAASFWTEARISKLVVPLAEQVRRPSLDRPLSIDAYQATIKSFANAATQHFNSLQSLHQALLRHATEDSQRIQLMSIRALQAMWDSEAQPELIAFKPESMPTMAELLEAGGQVEQETKVLLATMAEGEEDAEMALDDDESDDQENADDDD